MDDEQPAPSTPSSTIANVGSAPSTPPTFPPSTPTESAPSGPAAPNLPTPQPTPTATPNSTSVSTSTPTPAPPPPSPAPLLPTPPPTPILVANILTMVLQNAVALSQHRRRPHSLPTLTSLRRLLLQDAFFDPLHAPHELAPRTRPGRLLFMDLVVLLAKLLRVVMRRGELGREEAGERVEVRNRCLDQPFFDRGWKGAMPFGEEGAEDEGCVV